MSKASEIKRERCPCCGEMVELNGVGSDSSTFYKILRKTFQFMFPITSTAFRPAADWHDMAVHQGPRMGERKPHFVKRVDDEFFVRCHDIASRCKGIKRLWLQEKAAELRGFLEENNGQNYPNEPCVQRKIDINAIVDRSNKRKAENTLA